VAEVVQELHRFDPFLMLLASALVRLSRTYVYVHDPEDLLIDDAPTVDQSGEPFLRLNFEYDVQGPDDFLVRAIPSQPTPTSHRLHIVDVDRPLTTAEQAAQTFFDESVTWQRAWAPTFERRRAQKRRRQDELSLSPEEPDSDPEDGDAGPESPQKKKKHS